MVATTRNSDLFIVIYGTSLVLFSFGGQNPFAFRFGKVSGFYAVARVKPDVRIPLEFFWEAVKDYEPSKQEDISPKTYAGKLYFLISDNYRRRFEQRMEDVTENRFYCKLQLITDQVAGMTDTHACEVHHRLTNS